ncbi:P-loop containing nucleoside triphosphate hydrolase protein [Dendrothele bispora CBS 962.96]|uniref:DNA 3'-5' helicase n=1 Tax=Dendrothele bispora (strain CBS 962.96) TaxID=1314807 RepID=A0A4S8MUU6_DENBC|nr:P-loop containing nucleoside triphosphate hydrolase protein [Dendrothele bispora CBS 962.96]
MSLPRNSTSKVNRVKKRSYNTRKSLPDIHRDPISDDELQNLKETIQTAFRWPEDKVPQTYQVTATKAQLQRKDVFVHAGTGSGKTAIVAAPHTHPKSKGKVSFLVSPLIALQEEQVENFQTEYHLTAIAINSAHGGLTKENMEAICSGKYQIVVISPEMMLTQRFIKLVLKNKELAHRLLAVVIDEGHVISHWGSGFRKKYGELGILRVLLPKGTPFVVLSATLPPRVREDILAKLHFSTKTDGFVDINLGNDRPNVSLVVRAIQHPMNTYQDLNFVIPGQIDRVSQIPKTFIYADNVSVGVEMEDHLETLLPENLRGKGLIRPYNAGYSQKYRNAVMKQFRAGRVRVLICTDAAGMGCNIADIDVVVQWKLTDSMSSFVQRAGRAARGRGRTGLAVLLVEKSAYTLDCEHLLSENSEALSKSGKKGRKTTSEKGEYRKATTKDYADLHGVKRGAYGGIPSGMDKNHLPEYTPSILRQAKDEGLLAFVQTGTCRRMILSLIYNNHRADPTVPCCDICDCSLLNRTRPGRYKAPSRRKAVVQGVIYQPSQLELHSWRVAIHKRDFKSARWGYTALLSDATVEFLSAAGPINSKEELKRMLAHKWGWWEKFGDELWAKISSMNIPPMVPLPKNNRKRKEPEQADNAAHSSEPKRRRNDNDGGSEETCSTVMPSSNDSESSNALPTLTMPSHHQGQNNGFQHYPTTTRVTYIENVQAYIQSPVSQPGHSVQHHSPYYPYHHSTYAPPQYHPYPTYSFPALPHTPHTPHAPKHPLQSQTMQLMHPSPLQSIPEDLQGQQASPAPQTFEFVYGVTKRARGRGHGRGTAGEKSRGRGRGQG